MHFCLQRAKVPALWAQFNKRSFFGAWNQRDIQEAVSKANFRHL